MRELTELPHRTDIVHQSDVAGLLFCGAVAVLIFFVSILYFKNRERIYLFYTLFLLCSLVYGFINIKASTWIGELFGNYFYANRRIIEPITLLAFSAYIFFTVELIDIGNQSRRVAQAFYIWAVACVVYAIAYYALYPIIIAYTSYIFMTVRVIIFSLSTYFIIWIIRHIQSPVKGPFVLGSLAYFIGSIVASVRFSFSDLPLPGLYAATAPTYFEAGILVETLFFALALGQRFVHLVEEKQVAQAKHIEQLNENRLLVSEMNKRLEKKVKSREEEIIRTQENLNKEEKKRLKAEFDIEMAKSEMLTRTLQINPHFLFNCLNSITYLIQSDQNKIAIEYLVVFSRFIRMVLENSRKQVIPIQEELSLIEKYLKLEKNRFDNDFSYSISGANNPLLQGVMVPPMLFHPAVENAVWHGLMNSPKKNKEITVVVTAGDNQLAITITDNGAGPGNSDQKKTTDKQLGISLTNERIKLFNYSFDDKIDFKLIEFNDGRRAGTKAEFIITLAQK
ncbi:MAG TPA: histidine kinase [Parapedobacter sp.]|uniref:sensor histidine kinase n=1 Tax=Parapedobacter sp. TaxID=1958893 RepID=UPI002BD2DE74|nr:histidine kinase [Parapedobacter sp.]HWK57432.1 histidine kinase [Parapedobacter sp.]